VIETEDPFARALDVELELVETAIRLVASGVATRVVVSNLAYGRVVVEPARALAEESSVSLTTVPAAGGERQNVVVSSMEPISRTD
jgi:hypothetical protein